MQAIPLILNFEDTKIKIMMKSFHGVLMTGGAAAFFYSKKTETGEEIPKVYLQKIALILEEAKRMNDEGQYFFIWGTCLGQQSVVTSIMERSIKDFYGNQAMDY